MQLSCPTQPEKEKPDQKKHPSSTWVILDLQVQGKSSPRSRGQAATRLLWHQQPYSSAEDTEVTARGFGVIMARLAVPCEQASWAHPQFFTCSSERGVRRQKGSGLEAGLASQHPGTDLVASVSEGPGGRLAKNLKNKQVCICFQVICARLKTIDTSCEICKVQNKRLQKD